MPGVAVLSLRLRTGQPKPSWKSKLWTRKYQQVIFRLCSQHCSACATHGGQIRLSVLEPKVMAAKRTCAALGIALALVAGCSDRRVVSGVFNNQPDYKKAMLEHEAAWRGKVGDTVTRPELSTLVRGAGGHCFPEQKLMICIVNVQARRPRFFTTRHMWRIELEDTNNNRLRHRRSHVDILGWDL